MIQSFITNITYRKLWKMDTTIVYLGYVGVILNNVFHTDVSQAP